MDQQWDATSLGYSRLTLTTTLESSNVEGCVNPDVVLRVFRSFQVLLTKDKFQLEEPWVEIPSPSSHH